MKVLVIGATGGTGSIAVRRLLDRGDEVTAFARSPEKVAPKHERLRVAKGEARDRASLEAAVAGQDAVLSAFGPRRIGPDDLQEVFMGNLVAAMEAHGPKRLVNLSGWGAGDSKPHSSLFARFGTATVLRFVYRDKERGEAILFASSLDWVNVRPGMLRDSDARGNVGASLDGRIDGTTMAAWMTRADLAAFMIEQLTSDEWVRRSVLIGYRK